MNNDVSPSLKNHYAIQVLFFLGMIVVCLDVISIDLGNFKLKISYVWFPLYLILFAYFFDLRMRLDNVKISAIFILSFLPSVLFSSNLITSVAFYAGTCICLVIMFTFSKMVYLAPVKIIKLLFLFYRFSVMLTAAMVVMQIQYRGHFLLYEPSYYAVALIPYFCITFHRAFLYGFKISIIDLFFIFLAIFISQSVSMVLWIFICFVLTYISFGRVRLIYFAYFCAALLFFLLIAYFFDARTRKIIDGLYGLFSNPSSSLNLLVFVVGNRLQRVLVAYQAFTESPFFGVGLGTLKAYSSSNFNASDFIINGITAADFIVESTAANVFVEVGAEAGIIGFIGFMSILFFIHRKKNNYVVLAPFKIAFYVTMAALLIDSSYLRTYVWALYGIILGLSALEKERLQDGLFFRPS
ncbi:O-antigen ligase family protein [Janthinobacterium rivuli]|uniref:O-antigen ligase family protein n=1 Tax=Janthinobacterium rivuli TaxID=2751478 RepID=A0ABY8I5R1_9BURK|nr:O-antigen ligase family protein [Janthinobacterium rivuli]WFR79433.1 O-antigen ligase family protein [Janthinobacterium rivuli]